MWDSIHVATVDVEEGYEDAFNKWYNEVHLPEMMGCPGWAKARRYECTNGQPRFLALYELSDDVADPFSSDEYEAAYGWDEFARRIRNSHSRNYRAIHSIGSWSSSVALIHAATVDVEHGYEDSFNRWYNGTHLPEILACPGWLAATRYECTNGEPHFLALYELESEEKAFNSSEYEAAFGWDEFARRIRNSYSRNYRAIYSLDAPASADADMIERV